MIGDKIKNRRVELGWTQEDLARKMGYKHCSSINKIELGINDIPQSKIKKFADVLGVSVPYLLGFDRLVAYRDQLEKMINRLDDVDRAKIEERVSTLLEQEKYR